ncbi:MAG: pseudouridine synthase [Actinomycetes bacterium]
MPEVRLQKVLAEAGLGSRRKCEEFISSGRVTVDGVIVDELGSRVDPEVSIIHIDGVRIAQASGKVVFAFNKPKGVITAMSDPHGQQCVGDFVTNIEERLFHVGRLDSDTEGLLLLTNDGELAQRLGHPSYGISKTYVAKVSGNFDKNALRDVLAGVMIEDRPVEVTRCRIIDQSKAVTVLELEIHEGRNRIVRRLFDALGYPVLDLVRVQVGPVKLAQLKSGQLRQIANAELGKLYLAVGL